MIEYNLRITGITGLTGEIKASERLKITGEVDIYEVANRDLHTGDFQRIYKGKFVSGVTVEQQGKKVPGIDRLRESQKTRMAIEDKRNELGSQLGEEEYYQHVQQKIRENLTAIIKTFCL